MVDNILNFVSGIADQVSPAAVIWNMIVAAVLALVIYITYYVTFTGVIYSKKFNLSLIMMTLISAAIISIIANSIAMSLGMLGALSVVRFRTAVKDPRDTAYIYWSVAVGIGAGSGSYSVVMIATVFIAVLTVIMNFGIKGDDRYLVIVRGKAEAMMSVRAALFNACRSGKLRAETVTDTYSEIVYQIKLKKDTDITNYEKIRDINGVDYVNVVAQNGEVLG